MLRRMAKSRILTSPNAGVNVEQQELIVIATLEDSLAVPDKQNSLTVRSNSWSPLCLPK